MLAPPLLFNTDKTHHTCACLWDPQYEACAQYEGVQVAQESHDISCNTEKWGNHSAIWKISHGVVMTNVERFRRSFSLTKTYPVCNAEGKDTGSWLFTIWVKVNADQALSTSTGLAGFIRAELSAILYGLQSCIRRGTRNILLESDSKLAISLLNKGGRRWKHILSEANQSAEALAKERLHDAKVLKFLLFPHFCTSLFRQILCHEFPSGLPRYKTTAFNNMNVIPDFQCLFNSLIDDSPHRSKDARGKHSPFWIIESKLLTLIY
ncbi:hypothetical protein VNO78_21450 [Psophocarpus tetragonolobus]|uniref:RNase H type-1 domain-containing protein n=1 Tax=Psophocarpus tetragonolobus TaxID=3891 RepID=A0AAN9SC58_PSOTE